MADHSGNAFFNGETYTVTIKDVLSKTISTGTLMAVMVLVDDVGREIKHDIAVSKKGEPSQLITGPLNEFVTSAGIKDQFGGRAVSPGTLTGKKFQIHTGARTGNDGREYPEVIKIFPLGAVYTPPTQPANPTPPPTKQAPAPAQRAAPVNSLPPPAEPDTENDLPF
jgi:hypothetical protein